MYDHTGKKSLDIARRALDYAFSQRVYSLGKVAKVFKCKRQYLYAVIEYYFKDEYKKLCKLRRETFWDPEEMEKVLSLLSDGYEVKEIDKLHILKQKVGSMLGYLGTGALDYSPIRFRIDKACRKKIVKMAEQGYNVSNISTALGITHQAVSNYLLSIGMKRKKCIKYHVIKVPYHSYSYSFSNKGSGECSGVGT